MTRKQQWLLLAAIVLVATGAVSITMYGLRDELFPVDYGANAPSFVAKDLYTGKTRSFDEYKGQVVLVNVWATWCVPCRVEMPSLEKLYKEFQPYGFKIVAVNTADDAADSIVTGFVRGYGLTFDIWRDQPEPGKDSMSTTYKVTGYPETFIVDKSGVIRKKWSSADTWNSDGNRALIAQLLGRPVPAPLPRTVGDTAVPSRAR